MSIRLTLAAFAVALSTALAPAVAFAQAAPVPVQAPRSPIAVFAAGATHVELPAPNGRTVDLSVWQAPDERAVVIFSHGFNGSPAAYGRMLSQWVGEGFTVVAPLHVDSLRHPHHADYDNQAAFATRIADLAIARGFVRATHAGKPLIAAGHSFGSLMSLIEGGAVTVAGPLGDPHIKAVVAFSSAGDLPGVIQPATYADLHTPTLMITGDADLVEGYVTDWHAHRSPFERSPAGDKMLLVFAGADHSLVRNADEADFDLMLRTTTDFMEAYGLGDAAARARLDALTAPEGVSLERR
ncbi:MAG: alpha/beta hydrolase [Brevundimonas sp.]|nr:MAG: alpha/beta hydrolase [Brevundimonas sp.]